MFSYMYFKYVRWNTYYNKYYIHVYMFQNGSIIRVMYIVHVHNVHAKHTQLKKRVYLLDQQREVHKVLR